MQYTADLDQCRIVDVRLFLRDQHYPLVGAHGDVERLNRLLSPDEERDNHVGINDHVPQGQDAPYVVIGDDTATDWDTKSKAGWEFTVTIHAWDFNGRSPSR